ncbi:MAG: hypothetical protein AABW65_01470 [Nanoarchaeota archaeon]
MFWNKKEEKKNLPDLPAEPIFNNSLSPPKKENHNSPENHALPSFPDSPMEQGFSQSAIKNAIANDEPPEINEVEDTEIPKIKKSFKTVEISDSFPQPSKIEEPNKNLVPSPSYQHPKSQEIYIKIDKYRSVKIALNEIKTQLEDIDDLLKKIRETKLREEQELSSWEKSIVSVKSRIKDVNDNIFEKL